MSQTTPTKAWCNGHICFRSRLYIHALSHAVNYGSAIFEGIRARNRRVFRLDDHVKRFFASAKKTAIPLPHSPETVKEGVLETLRANDLDCAYIRPVLLIGGPDGEVSQMSVAPKKVHSLMYIEVWPWGGYYLTAEDEAEDRGARFVVPKRLKISPECADLSIKGAGYYFMTRNTMMELRRRRQDFHELLYTYRDPRDGKVWVAEGGGCNIFIRKDDRVITPDAGILPGLTRNTVMRLLDGRIEVEERRMSVSEVLCADEAWVTGTAAEVSPLTHLAPDESAEMQPIGSGQAGPLSKELRAGYRAAALGEDPAFESMLTSY